MVKSCKTYSRENLKKRLPSGWRIVGNCTVFMLRRKFEFEDFRQAWKFMEKIANEAERINHHPGWINSYNKVTITLITHDAGGVTDNDINLASFINSLLD